MGANASNYPHSCSPRVGGNSQAQQTFIGKLSVFLTLISFATINRIVFSGLWIKRIKYEKVIDNSVGSIPSQMKI